MSNLDAIRALQATQAKPAAPKTGQKGRRPSRKPSSEGDADIKAMLAEVDLLSVIQADTGERGRKSGERIDFRECPVCRHRDCFSYYPSTNSWSCFGASNTSGYEGGSALEYYKATRGVADTEAVKWLRGETGHPYEPKPRDGHTDGQSAQGGEQGEGDGETLLLPPWENVRASDPPSRNPVLIEGVVRRGHVMLLAGKGKIGKSWSAIELCVSVATGCKSWFGLPLKSSGACLYIDPELDPKSLDNRFQTVCNAMSADTAKADSAIAKWSLRGIPGASMDAIIHDLQARSAFDQFALVVIDSCSCFVEGDENSSVDVRAFAAKVLQVTRITGATVLLVHHFGKAKDGDRSAADRARGSSVWLDFPDAVLTLTELLPPSGQPSDYLQTGEYACILESGGIREFPRMEPIRLIFGYPVHRVDDDGITESWKPSSSQGEGGRLTAELNKAKKATDAAKMCAEVLARFYSEGIGEEGMLAPDLAKLMSRDTRTLKEAVKGCPYLEVFQATQRKHYIRPTHAPRASPTEQGELPLEQD